VCICRLVTDSLRHWRQLSAESREKERKREREREQRRPESSIRPVTGKKLYTPTTIVINIRTKVVVFTRASIS
jgi:hypothetical protein